MSALSLLVGASALGWLAQGIAWVLAARAVRRLADLPLEERRDWPKVSLVIAARNEGVAVRDALRARLEEGYPNLEVVFVDDRSDDDTGAHARAVAQADPRVTVLRVDSLPEGWLGKVHALQRGLDVASGTWVLFSDADVHLAPGTLRRVIAWADTADHVAVLPAIVGPGPLTSLTLAAFYRLIATAPRLWAVHDPDSSAAIGVGAFNLVRREALDRTDGLAWLKMEIGDDVALGLLLKRQARARARVLVGGRSVSLQFFPSYTALCRSLEKNGGTVPLPLTLLGLALMLVVELGWVAGFAIAPGLGLALWATLAAFGMLVARWLESPVWPALLPGLGGGLLAIAMARSALLAFVRGGVVWRGSFYPTKVVRAGRRLG